MVKNFWIRGQELANAFGLLFGGIGIAILGYQMSNELIMFLGTASTTLFAILCIGMIFLSIRDAIFHHKNFFVSLPFKG